MITFFISSISSFIFYKIYSNYSHHLPKLKFLWFQLFPSVKITISGRIIHLHHWFGFLVILTVSIFVNEGLLTSLVARGFLTGGIIQGISHPDRKIFKRIQL